MFRTSVPVYVSGPTQVLHTTDVTDGVDAHTSVHFDVICRPSGIGCGMPLAGGLETFDEAIGVAEGHVIAHGYLPRVDSGPIGALPG